LTHTCRSSRPLHQTLSTRLQFEAMGSEKVKQVSLKTKVGKKFCSYKSVPEESTLTQKLASSAVTILDGGMGHQLKAMGIEVTGEVGSMRRFLGVACANTEQPDMVRDAHLAYIDAGAEVITTNSYACVPKCLEQSSLDSLDLKNGGLSKLVAAAGQRAKDACALRCENRVKVAGSLPPLADSYRPDLVGPFEDNVKQYTIIAQAIAPFSDYLLCETMSTVDEARAAVTAAATTGLPIWVSWTLNEENPVLRSGESIKDAFEAIRSVQGANLQAVLFNCTSPEVISVAVPMLRDLASGLQIGAYANGFCTSKSVPKVGSLLGSAGAYRDLTPEQYYEEFAAKWIESGATIIGGCCGVFPNHIAHMTRCLRC